MASAAVSGVWRWGPGIAILQSVPGAVAQLGEHLLCKIQKHQAGAANIAPALVFRGFER